MPLKLYDYAASGNCYKVRLLLAQLGLPYERIPIDIFGGDTLTPEYAKKNPARATPVLELENGEYVTESNAILFYLGRGTDFRPEEPACLADVVRWLIFEQTDVMMTMGGLRFRLLTGRLAPDDPEAVRRHEAAQDALAFLDQHLAARDFLAADRYTIADVSVYAYGHVAPDAGLDLAPYPAFREWLARVEAQPGYMNDLVPYPENARPGMGESVYG